MMLTDEQNHGRGDIDHSHVISVSYHGNLSEGHKATIESLTSKLIEPFQINKDHRFFPTASKMSEQHFIVIGDGAFGLSTS